MKKCRIFINFLLFFLKNYTILCAFMGFTPHIINTPYSPEKSEEKILITASAEHRIHPRMRKCYCLNRFMNTADSRSIQTADRQELKI